MPRGRKPIPAEIKKKMGDGVHDSGGRVIPETPKADPNAPARPAHLSDSAGKAWDRLTRALADLGVLSATDSEALTLCAELLGTTADAYEQLKTGGTVVKVNGQVIPNPYWGVYSKATAQAKSLLAEFGLTPSGRARVKAKEPENDPADFSDLGGGGGFAKP